MVLYILTFTFLNSRREGKRLWTEWKQALPKFNLPLISSFMLVFFQIVYSHIVAEKASQNKLPNQCAVNLLSGSFTVVNAFKVYQKTGITFVFCVSDLILEDKIKHLKWPWWSSG
jgi:hypothetical protein